MQFSNEVTSITRETIIPKVFDTINTGTPALLRTLGNAKPWDSGFRLDVIAKFKKSTVGGLVPIGGTLDTSRQDTRIKMQFEPQRIHKPVVIDDIEITLNDGDEGVLNLLATETESVAQDLIDDIAGFLYTGTSAQGGASSFDSYLNAADDATNFGNYGNKSRTTYTSLKGYYAAGIGSLALSDMATAYDGVQVGSDRPTFIVTTPAAWTAYEGLLAATVRAGYSTTGFPQVTRNGMVASRAALGGQAGFDSVFYRGTPVVADEKCTSQKMFFVNERLFNFHGVDLKGYDKVNLTAGDNVDGPLSVPIPRGFNWSGLLRPTDQPAEVGHLYYVGNFVSKNPRTMGQLTGITG